MNRRNFLHPRQLAQTTGQVLAALDEPPAQETAPPEIALLRIARRAMATQFEVLLPFGTPFGQNIAAEALDEIDRLERQLTVYHDHSEISRLNRFASQRPVTVEERLFRLLTLAEQIHRETDGAYDITAGPLIKAWGFFRRQGRVPSEAERAAVLTRVGMHCVELNAERRTVFFQVPGLEINLGSIGKGYALDRAAEELRNEWNLPAGLLHGGHSSVYAMGRQPGDPRGWPVGISHPEQADRRLAVVWLQNQGLATSAATFQNLEYNGKKLGHILDPRTGWPAEGMASATVIAPTAAEADALSTAFFVLGVDAARAYCEAHPGIGAVLLPADADVPVVIGLDERRFALVDAS